MNEWVAIKKILLEENYLKTIYKKITKMAEGAYIFFYLI